MLTPTGLVFGADQRHNEPVAWPTGGAGGIFGAPAAGKSVTLRTIAGQATKQRHAVWQATSLAANPGSFIDQARTVTTPAAATAMLREAADLTHKGQGFGVDGTPLLITIDDADKLFRDRTHGKNAVRAAEAIARRAHRRGITLIIAAQTCTAAVIPPQLRAQLSTQLLMRHRGNPPPTLSADLPRLNALRPGEGLLDTSDRARQIRVTHP